MGKTATGRDMTVGAGPGAEKKRAERQKSLRK